MKAPMQISNNARSDVVWFCHFLNFQLERTTHSWPNVPLHVIYTNDAIFFLLFPTTWGSSVLAATAKTRTEPEQLTQVMCFFPLQGEEGQARWASTHHTPRAMTTQQCPPHRWPGPARPPHHIWPQRPGTFSFPLFKMHQWFPFNTCSS